MRHSPIRASQLARERSSGPSLPAGCVVLQVRAVLRPPPTPSRPPPTSRLHTGYRTALPAPSAARSGRGGPLQFPPPPSERSAPSYAGESLAAAFQDLHRFHGLRRDSRGSALSCPLTTRQASLDAADRSVAPLLLKGFRRWAPARPVSRPSRQPATGLPGDYPDRTLTGRRRRASDQVMIAGQPPPDALGARNLGLRPARPANSRTSAP